MRVTSRKTTGAIYANDRCDVCEQQEPRQLQGSGWRQTAVFINHQAMMTSIKPTHVPVHERIRTSFNRTHCGLRGEKGEGGSVQAYGCCVLLVNCSILLMFCHHY